MLLVVGVLHLVRPARSQTAPVNDLFTNATLISDPVVTITASNVGATKEPGEPNHAGNIGGASVWWTWTPPTNGTVTIDTLGSAFDTLLAVYRGASISSLTAVASSDDVGGGFNASRVSFSAVAGTNYLIAVDGFAGASGDILLNLNMSPALPLITSQPQSRVVVRGGSVTFQVQATGAAPLAYQWCMNGTNISGATSTSYALSNIQATNAGIYTVVVTNTAGLATSSNALLAVNDIVITNQPQSLTLAAGYDANFSVGAVGTAPLSYQWQKGGLDIPGATGASYSITNVQTTNMGAYDVVISGAGSLTSSVATLTVMCPYTFVTFAGMAGVSGTNDGVGSAARFWFPHGIAVDSADNVYITELNGHTIRKLTPAGVVSTVAGTPGISGTNDGPGAAARFNQPWALTVDQQTNIYVADSGNHTIRKIAPDGTVTTLAGKPGVRGYANGTNGNAKFDTPSGVVMNTEGALYVSEYYNQTIRKLMPSSTNWVVSTVAGGLYSSPSYVDGKGLSVRLAMPGGLAMDRVRKIVYFADELSDTIRKMAPEGVVTTLAGMGSVTSQFAGSADGTGTAARFNGPHSPSVDSAGNVFLADTWNHTVRRITPDGVVTTLGGLAGVYGRGGGTGNNVRFSDVRGVVVDRQGNLYVPDFQNQTICKAVPFAISTWPQDHGVLAGTPVTLNVAAAGDNGPFSYQWLSNSVALVGQTNTTFEVGPVVRTNSGVYSVVVSNAVGNWITIDASVRALVAPVFQAPQMLTNRTLRLLFQDADGGVPYDLSKVTLQWRTNLPSANDTNWISLTSACYLTNGFAAIDDTNAVSLPSRFYRITER